MNRLLLTAVVLLGFTVPLQAQDKKKKPAPQQPAPTFAAQKYGTHERQVLDFWQAPSEKPTPVVLYIHGGDWRNGDKGGLSGAAIKQFLAAGISVAAINYRFVQHGVEDKVEPPVKAPLEDAARALQYLRSRAAEWNIDKLRVGATGGSAGACSSLWLAFHDDMADPKSSDPVARESTRLYCAAVSGAQVSLDPKELREWIPNYGYGAHAFGLKTFQELYDKRDQVLKWIKEYSPIEHVSKDDPPIFLEYVQKGSPTIGTKQEDPTHSAVMGIKLLERLQAAGVPGSLSILVYTNQTAPPYRNANQFLIDRLRK